MLFMILDHWVGRRTAYDAVCIHRIADAALGWKGQMSRVASAGKALLRLSLGPSHGEMSQVSLGAASCFDRSDQRLGIWVGVGAAKVAAK